MCTNSTEDIPNNKEAKNSTEEVEKYFPGFLAFIDCTEQQIPRPVDKKEGRCTILGKKKRHTTVKNQIMVNNHVVISFIKQPIRKDKGMIRYLYKKNHPVLPKRLLLSS